MLDRRTFIVKERVAFMKLSDTYDILDAESGATIGVAEERISGLVRTARLLLGKRVLPTTVAIAEYAGGPAILTLSRRGFLMRADVRLSDADGRLLGRFVSKWFSVGGGFIVFDAGGNEAGRVDGDLIGWNYKFLTAGRQVGTISKKWAGLGKEWFTNADNYAIAVQDAKASPALVAFVLAAGIAIDTVFKERKK